MGDGQVLYEGCDKVLNDGQPYKLGKSARHNRLHGHPLPTMMNIRDYTRHVCHPVGSGKKMWNCMVVLNDLHIDIFEGPDQDLLGMLGQTWANQFGPNAYVEDVMEGLKKTGGMGLLSWIFATMLSFLKRPPLFVDARSKSSSIYRA